MTEILIGTSGFSYSDWKGAFYPNDTSPKDYLGYYSRHFRVVELNFSYYRLPEQDQIRSMVDKSGRRI